MAFIVLRHHGVNANGMSLRGIGMTTKSPWRPGLTQDRLVDELDRFATVPGLANIWVPPIRNRNDMLAIGIKRPVGERGVQLVRSDVAATRTARCETSSVCLEGS